MESPQAVRTRTKLATNGVAGAVSERRARPRNGDTVGAKVRANAAVGPPAGRLLGAPPELSVRGR